MGFFILFALVGFMAWMMLRGRGVGGGSGGGDAGAFFAWESSGDGHHGHDHATDCESSCDGGSGDSGGGCGGGGCGGGGGD